MSVLIEAKTVAGTQAADSPWLVTHWVDYIKVLGLMAKPTTVEITADVLCPFCGERHTLTALPSGDMVDGTQYFTSACPSTGKVITLVGRFGE